MLNRLETPSGSQVKFWHKTWSIKLGIVLCPKSRRVLILEVFSEESLQLLHFARFRARAVCFCGSGCGFEISRDTCECTWRHLRLVPLSKILRYVSKQTASAFWGWSLGQSLATIPVIFGLLGGSRGCFRNFSGVSDNLHLSVANANCFY